MLVNDDACFACGKRNPDGLRLEFSYTEDSRKAQTVFVPEKKHQGWQNIVHGGIILTLLDETMAKAAVRNGYTVLTGQIEARFKAPARVQEKLYCEAEVTEVKRSIVYARSSVSTESGLVIAEATAKMVIAKQSSALPELRS